MSRMSAKSLPSVVAATAAVLTLLGAILDGRGFMAVWLVAAVTGLALPLGAMAVLMTHNLTGGRWGEPVRAPLKATIATLPVMLALFVPLLFNADLVFAWVAPATPLPEVVEAKRFYLNAPFLYLRFGLYAVIWLTLAVRLNVWRAEISRPTSASAGGLVLWGITLTFFSFDWLMSLEPTWYSDIVGLIFMGSVLSMAPALMLLLPRVYIHGDREPLLEGARRDLAHLWLCAILFWAFVAFSQYLIIWSGDLPHEIRWYVHRSAGVWAAMAVVMMLLCAVLPFVALLPAAPKRRGRLLAGLAATVLLGHCVEFGWLILPAYPPASAALSWRAPVALVAVFAVQWMLIDVHRARARRPAAERFHD
ncbi:hypothetical protein [Alloalcanivorax mobilis]|uniref:hypothetical protein n=1 Tax=Alloalcanivorax mobilis TaxID=2019569 RepID=UPI001300017E|nr:hypothetical protein [Alloalcanivorax mobilis]